MPNGDHRDLTLDEMREIVKRKDEEEVSFDILTQQISSDLINDNKG